MLALLRIKHPGNIEAFHYKTEAGLPLDIFIYDAVQVQMNKLECRGKVHLFQ